MSQIRLFFNPLSCTYHLLVYFICGLFVFFFKFLLILLLMEEISFGCGHASRWYTTFFLLFILLRFSVSFFLFLNECLFILSGCAALILIFFTRCRIRILIIVFSHWVLQFLLHKVNGFPLSHGNFEVVIFGLCLRISICCRFFLGYSCGFNIGLQLHIFFFIVMMMMLFLMLRFFIFVLFPMWFKL